MNICTIIAKNYAAHARVLAESFTRHHPDGRCFTLIIDDFDDAQIDPETEPFEIVRPGQLPLAAEDFDDMRARYDVLEFSTAVKPWLLRHMLDEVDDGTGIAYFDPDIQVHSRMVELEEVLAKTAIVLTPHLTKPMPRDGGKPSETDIMIAGIYNLGFIGLSARPDSDALIEFWQERLRTDCWVAPEQGLFVDQKWVDWIPGLLTDLEILRHPAYNVAYWNLPTRELGRKDGGVVTVDGEPLRFFHFSGYSPRHPRLLSKHQDRIDLDDDDILDDLCTTYGAALVRQGFHDVSAFDYTHNAMPSGHPLSPYSRRLYRDAADTGLVSSSIFSADGEAAFVAWMREDAPETPGVSRYLRELWLQRPDLQAAYPDLAGADRDGFLGWCDVHGASQVPIPPEMLRSTGGGALLPTAESPEPETTGSDTPVPSDERRFGLNIVGYLRSELGIGEVARQMSQAVDVAGVPSTPISLTAPNSRSGHPFATPQHVRAPYRANLVFVNADGFPQEAARLPEVFDGRPTIGYWWWEIEDFPPVMHPALDLVDEVWAGTTFVADAIRRHTKKPVHVVPVPIDVTLPPPLEPGQHGWPSDRFSFLFSWDYNSVFRRKNPLGLIEAYTSAFAEDDGAALVLKCINGRHDPVNHALVREAAGRRSDIHLIDGYLPARDKDRLTATCDCYVSLHRSEGLGLTIAEAMLAGKPVIATDYSGNTDFMTADNSYPVDVRMVPVGLDSEPYPATSLWAEPDLDHAADHMRAVFEDREEAAARAARGRRTIRDRYSAEAVAVTLRRELSRFEGEAAPFSLSPIGIPALDGTVSSLVGRGTTPRAPSRFGKPGAAARKAVLRTIKPYTAYQRDVNAGVLARIDELRDRAVDLARDAVEQARAYDEQLAIAGAEDLSAVLRELRSTRRAVTALTEAQAAHSIAAEKTTAALQHELAELRKATDERLAAPERLVAQTEAIPYMASAEFSTFTEPGWGQVFGYRGRGADRPDDDRDDEYRRFEELFRGSESFIAERQRNYLPLLDGHGPVLDIGCGRGEMLDLLRDAGIEARGIDSDAGMVRRCRDKGHDVEKGEALGYLDGLADGSLGAIFSAQVVEHIPAAGLRELIAIARQKLRPGGLFIAETVNPHNPAALKTFWVDVTHQHPLFPEVMVAFCRIAGFSAAHVLHPNGSGDVERDRFTTGEYAVVATR